MDCPRCAHRQVFDGPECERCGVVFARIPASPPPEPLAEREPAQPGSEPEPAPPYEPPAGVRAALAIAREQEPRPNELDARGWRAAAIGSALAVATLLMPFLQMLIQYMVVLIHELGHAAAGWAFGFPSIPAFDFLFGGGVTSHGARAPWLVALVVIAWTAGVWQVREHALLWRAGLGVLGIYGLALITGADDVLIIAMGHGAELLFAGLFFGRALTGVGCKVAAERPLYAWIAVYIVLFDLRFAWRLATSAVERANYGAAKGGGHWMDFSRLAAEFGVPLETVAISFLLATLAPLPLALAWALRRAPTPAGDPDDRRVPTRHDLAPFPAGSLGPAGSPGPAGSSGAAGSPDV